MHVCLLMPCGHLLEKGPTSWLSFVMSDCDVFTFPLVSWVRCAAWLYQFLIFALFLTLINMRLNMRLPTMRCVRPAKWFEYFMIVKLLPEHHLEFLSLKRGCNGSSESTLVKMPHCRKSHVAAQLYTQRQ